MNFKRNLFIALIAIGAASLFMNVSQAQQTPTITPLPTEAMAGMGGMDTDSAFSADELSPLVRGIFEGEDVLFIHTEASDPQVAQMLTNMMAAEVVVVPSLADIPGELLGKVYVFTNGIVGDGPMGFQPDVFDSVPGDENYTPLRAVHLVTWENEAEARQLNSASEIQDALDDEAISLEAPGIVVNMPILVWPGGRR